MYRLSLCIALLIFTLLACSSDKEKEVKSAGTSERAVDVVSGIPSDAAKPSYSLEITPQDAYRNTTFHIIPKNFNPQNAEIMWLINGIPIPDTTTVRVKATEVKKGDTIQAKATINGYEVISNPVKIKNSKPGINMVKILPEVFKFGDTIYVEVSGVDIDGDELTFTYEWIKNGEPAGNSNQIAGSLKRGDRISVKITPFDGESHGETVVFHREVGNLPPMFIESKEFSFDGNVYAYQTKAEDPDGDTLVFSLKSSLPGMVIDPSTGLISWPVPPDTRGKQNFTVSVTDGHGGEALQQLTFEIPQVKR